MIFVEQRSADVRTQLKTCQDSLEMTMSHLGSHLKRSGMVLHSKSPHGATSAVCSALCKASLQYFMTCNRVSARARPPQDCCSFSKERASKAQYIK